MAGSSSATLRKVPGRIIRSVIRPNQRSTWLSQELLAGVEWKWKRRRAFGLGQRLTAALLWVLELSTMRWISDSGRTSRSSCCRNFTNSRPRWRAWHVPMTLPVRMLKAANEVIVP